jgi:hypothetical protein
MIFVASSRPLRSLFAAGASDDLAYLLDVLADAGDGVAASQDERCESEGEYFFHKILSNESTNRLSFGTWLAKNDRQSRIIEQFAGQSPVLTGGL